MGKERGEHSAGVGPSSRGGNPVTCFGGRGRRKSELLQPSPHRGRGKGEGGLGTDRNDIARARRVLPPVSPIGFGCEDWPLGDGGPPTGVTHRRKPELLVPSPLEGEGRVRGGYTAGGPDGGLMRKQIRQSWAHTNRDSITDVMGHPRTSRQCGAANILLLRVGIDLGCGGTLGPIFPDGTFEYVPIPESPQYVSPRSVCYHDLPARHGGTLAQYVPRRYHEAAAHYDPEFETFTYGDPTRNKRAQLLRLDNEDLLVFYAGLRPIGFSTESRLYIIGYFTVSSVESVDGTDSWPPKTFSHLLGNAHLRRNRPDHGLVVASGHAQVSKLLDRAIAISDEAQRATPETEKRLGISGSLKRAIGRWVPSERIGDALDWIIQ